MGGARFLLTKEGTDAKQPQERATLEEIPFSLKSKIPYYRELFHAWEMWRNSHLEKPLGERFCRQDPCPQRGSLVGNQACIVPRLL